MEVGQEMTAGGSDGDGNLLAGLPDELVLMEIITRLSWFTRPVCRSVSKAWRAWIDASTKRPDALIRSREHHLPLLQVCILLSAFHFQTFLFKEASRCGRVQWRGPVYYVNRRWREFPSLQYFFPQRADESLLVEASAGAVYAWTNGKPHRKFVAKMDVAGADRALEKMSLPYRTTTFPISGNGKTYGGESSSTSSSSSGNEGLPVDQRLKRDNLRVLHRKMSSGAVEEEELYCLIKHLSPTDLTLEILAYNDCAKSWRTREMIAIPRFHGWRGVKNVQLANGDCFEPAQDQGINAVWINDQDSILRWFNSSVAQTWVEFKYNTRRERKGLVYPHFVHGWLYGLFVKDDYDEQEEIESGWQEPSCIIMKGKMVVEHHRVVWEQWLDIECFRHTTSRK